MTEPIKPPDEGGEGAEAAEEQDGEEQGGKQQSKGAPTPLTHDTPAGRRPGQSPEDRWRELDRERREIEGRYRDLGSRDQNIGKELAGLGKRFEREVENAIRSSADPELQLRSISNRFQIQARRGDANVVAMRKLQQRHAAIMREMNQLEYGQ